VTRDQIILFTLLGFVFVFLVWGRWRYDIVAFCALLVALIAGVVPSEQAFAGFGHPATVIIALVLIVSRGLSNSGAVELVARYVVDSSRSVSAHIGILAGVGAALSAVMNNVGALALLMPVDIQAAANAKRSPALTLMPLSFATILGGMGTSSSLRSGARRWVSPTTCSISRRWVVCAPWSACCSSCSSVGV
jgi:di/tricarboxylate transporter